MQNEDALRRSYIEQRPGSMRLHGEAKKHFSSNGATHFIRVFDPFRPYISHASGCKKWDLDGNEYIDYIMGHGALILGHDHPAVVAAVQAQVARGVLYGENHALEVEWARLIKEMIPSAEKVLFFACGNEANMMALRLSRVATGRKKILRFEKHYHGWADELASPADAAVIQDHVTVIPHNDLTILENELSGREYAALLTEGGGAFIGGKVPLDPDFVRQIGAVAKKYGTLWILDEVVTGFRVAPGGWQEKIGVKPDLTTLGKCVSGGLSSGALVGRAELFNAMKPGAPADCRINHGGTWNANPLAAAAGVAALRELQTGRPQEKADQAAVYLRRKGNEILAELGISGAFYGFSSVVFLYLGARDYEPDDDRLPPTKDPRKLIDPAKAPLFNRLLFHLLSRGVSNIGGSIFILSAEHGRPDLDYSLEAIKASLEALQNEGSYNL